MDLRQVSYLTKLCLGKIFKLPVILIIILISNTSAFNAQVIERKREEIIQLSDLIFEGKLLQKKSRWNNKGNLIVTDYTFAIIEVLYSEDNSEVKRGVVKNKIKLTFAGGEINNEGHSISDVPEFNINDIVLLMLEKSNHPLFSPVTGMYQGKFKSVTNPSSNNAIVHNGNNRAINDHKGKPLSFRGFVNLIKQEIPQAKKKPLPNRLIPIALQSSVINTMNSKIYSASSSLTHTSNKPIKPAEPISNQSVYPIVQEINQGVDNTTEADEPINERFDSYAYSHRAKNVPIVFNPLPDGGEFSLHDQYQMSYWNKYADIFQVSASTGTWAWGNSVYDIAGFVDNQTMIDEFGQGWGSTTLGICWTRWDSSGFSIEADIALNPSFNWTVDDYSTYSNYNLFNADSTLLHEIGHAWGLEHQFSQLSIMNYAPHKYRAYNVLYRDDAVAVRAAFSTQVVNRIDLGISLFYSSNYMQYSDSTLSSQNIQSGSSFTISDFIIENSGTTTIDTPTISWYLVPVINSWSNAIFIGESTHSSLDTGTYFQTSRTLSIPLSTPAGTYFLAAFISDDLTENNSSWLDRPITVSATVAEDGVCGSSHNDSFNSIPTENLCSVGSTTTVTGTGPWSWNCLSITGGNNVSCTANISDSDNDGIPDNIDNCPLISNTNQINTDNADDGGDACDDDDDNDSLNDNDEITHSTNPLNPDSDNDDIFDGYEVTNGLNPLQNDSTEDADSDGLTNLEEYNLGTSSLSSDTDGDGLLDYEEVNIHGTDPTLSDSDKDGMEDKYELDNGFNPLDSSDCPGWMCGSSNIWLLKLNQTNQ